MTDKTKYYIAKFLVEAGFNIPIWLFFLRDVHHLDQSLAFLLQSTVFVFMLLFEVPSGAWADRFGRKNLLIFSAFCRIISALIYCLTGSLLLLFIACFLDGLGAAASSGTLEALITDNLKAEKISDEGIFENGHSIFFVSRSITIVLGSFLYLYNPFLPYFAILLWSCLFLFSVLTIRELPYEKSLAQNNFHHFVENYKMLNKNKIIIHWLLAAFIIFLFSNVAWFEYQSIFSEYNWSPFYVSLLYAWGAIFSALGSACVKKMTNKINETKALAIYCFLTGVGTLGLSYSDYLIVWLSDIPYSLAAGAIYPIYVRLVNKTVSSSHRATTISILSFIDMLSCSIGLAVSGFINEWIGAVMYMRVLGLALIGLMLLPRMVVRSVDE